MSRGKVRSVTEVCADCSASDPTWASINRGIFICDECCSVHRSLGRHISQVKSLTKGQWSTTLLAMVQHLASHGANSIWEHSLLDPSQSKHGKKKPTPRDQVHPIKAEFIRSKYQFVQFINKQKDGEVNSIDDLSKQLHSCVRTNNLETCLRLLSKGADPNYFHPEKGNCPLHVAAQSGQPLQGELLVIYGADPGSYDANGKTPIDHARSEGHKDLADRLIECQYELTDRLAYYLCKRKPDHRNGCHFIIPEMADNSLDMSELAKQAKKKLQALPNHLFEELAMDVYDEVDRRENDEHWTATHENASIVSDRQGVPFLPLNPDFSATRNQGRQKLARFNGREFATLVIDILNDAKRRQTGVMSPVQTPKEGGASPLSQRRPPKINSIASDEEPIYDIVASDEDYSSIDNLSIKSTGMRDDRKDWVEEERGSIRTVDSTPKSIMATAETLQPHKPEPIVEGPVSTDDFLQMKKKASNLESQVGQLTRNNKDLQRERDDLTILVQRLTREISILRDHTQQIQQSLHIIPNGYDGQAKQGQDRYQSTVQGQYDSGGSGGEDPFDCGPSERCEGYDPGGHDRPESVEESPRSSTRPQSMFEPRDQQRLSQKSQSKDSLQSAQSLANIHVQEEVQVVASDSSEELQKPVGPDLSHYDCPSSLPLEPSAINHSQEPTLDANANQECEQGATSHDGCVEEDELPTQEEVMKKTERITKNIQELYLSGQEGKHDSFGPCADRIHSAVLDMASLFPQRPQSESVKCALHMLTTSARRLREECLNGHPGDMDPELEIPLKTQQVMQCAFDIARAAKQLVTLFQ
ncbi:ARF GTPase-activating protein GIT2-like isoform X2 [Mizuhopecten yessoensis]|uniref:ARF GTPase-activating protein GIT2-like isoform X2 n=1 Tax=Mizuhopecten yessoensis TaxID=6573 RepID=UPI000B458B36|nr:ARF GTPase-activating protein GIT2-like isoform X2 [Mizuhopecten yessoensis]